MRTFLKSAFQKEKGAQELKMHYSKELIRRKMRKTGAHDRKNCLEPSNQ